MIGTNDSENLIRTIGLKQKLELWALVRSSMCHGLSIAEPENKEASSKVKSPVCLVRMNGAVILPQTRNSYYNYYDYY